ncbi:leukocyte immunoglobulin-like receptor subfamily A member 1 [Hemiscyllium ocellatum]|uniref:leukocyte immunoglobulin-like receptor subfamily A member 1 n=1 Tax=Hemiscyllium ocellatum TaxID=170820 RepID=UPI002967404D|nr:leukocyte immunoglobulin-like receptor subfamily A member 1 [Hemiscyllium ocellatum]
MVCRTFVDKMFRMIFLLLMAVCPGHGRDYGNFPNPTITLEPVTGLALQGGVIIVKCETHTEDPKNVYLFQNGRIIYNVTSSLSSSVAYTIVNITSQHLGNYRCFYANIYDRRQKSRPSTPVRLSILGGIKAPLSVLQVYPAAEVTEGETFTMTCLTAASSRCFIFKGKQNEHFQIKEEKSNVTITIGNVTYCDEGNYSCYCLIDVSGKTVFTAQSDWLQVTVMDREEQINEAVAAEINSSLILPIALASTTFIVLNLMCAFLAVCLSTKKGTTLHPAHHGETELQDCNQ